MRADWTGLKFIQETIDAHIATQGDNYLSQMVGYAHFLVRPIRFFEILCKQSECDVTVLKFIKYPLAPYFRHVYVFVSNKDLKAMQLKLISYLFDLV